MTYRGHLAGGACAALIVLHAVPAERLALATALVGAFLGALAPDLDHRGAYLSRKLGPIHFLARSLVANPIGWFLLGRRKSNAPLRLPGTLPWSLRLYWNRITRFLLGRTLALRLTCRLARGRARLRTGFGHRALSHSLLGLVVYSATAQAAALAAAWGISRHLPLPAPLAPVVAWMHPQQATLPAWLPAWTPWYGWAMLVFGLAFALGYTSHILLDMLTHSGVPLLLPATDTRFHLLPPKLRVSSH